MSDIVERIDAMIEGHAARHGIAINDVVELLSDAKDALLGLPPEAYKTTGGGDNSLSPSISLQSELNKLRAELAEARDKALEEAATELERLDGFGEWHEAAQTIRALKSPKPPIL